MSRWSAWKVLILRSQLSFRRMALEASRKVVILLPYSSSEGLPKLSGVYILSQVILRCVWEAGSVLCIVGCLARCQASSWQLFMTTKVSPGSATCPLEGQKDTS